MLAKRLIPCLDVKDGRVVKGVQFQELRDCGDPVELGRHYSAEGADELVFLDIAATAEGRQTMLQWVNQVARQVFIPFTVGGGIYSLGQIGQLLGAGADRVSINSAAVRDPDLISAAARRFGNQCIVAAIDAKKGLEEWQVFVNGGRVRTDRDVLAWASELQERGAGEILLTSMDRDGTLSGYDLTLLERVSARLSIPVIASGGVGKLRHLLEGLLAGADAVLAASIFHDGQYSLGEAKEFLHQQGVAVRL